MQWRAELEQLLTSIDKNLQHAHKPKVLQPHIIPAPKQNKPNLQEEQEETSNNAKQDTLHFILDAKQDAMQKQIDALRHELAKALDLAETKAIELAKDTETAINSAVTAERELRKAGEATTTRLEAAVKRTRTEIFQAISELQGTCLDHSELLHRVEQDVLTFKMDSETRIADESKQLAALVEQQQQMVELNEVASAEQMISRVKETEVALLKERDLRKVIEKDMETMRSDIEAIAADLEASVARDLEREAATGSGSTLEEKVKECGRLILRMGGDLMEEGKRRQALEAEVHELRLRLSTVESLARAPLPVVPPPDQGLGTLNPMNDAGFQSIPTDFQTVPTTTSLGTAPPLPASEGTCDSAYIPAVSETWTAKTERVVDATLAGLSMPDGSSGNRGRNLSTSTSYSQLRPAIEASLSRSASYSQLRPSASVGQLRPSIPASQLRSTMTPAPRDISDVAPPTDATSRGSSVFNPSSRMTREQLDERVKQILGKHASASGPPSRA